VLFRWLGVSSRAYGVTVRNRGLRGTGMGRPFLFGGLRARVSSWPPLRLVRLGCERVSVGVVPSQRFPFVDQGEGSRGEWCAISEWMCIASSPSSRSWRTVWCETRAGSQSHRQPCDSGRVISA
jgi:hypothetical protein